LFGSCVIAGSFNLCITISSALLFSDAAGAAAVQHAALCGGHFQGQLAGSHNL
jgi:hypothetical protein